LRDGDCVYIMDSTFFQFPIWVFLLKNAPYEEAECFLLRIAAMMEPLHPALLYLKRKNIEDAIDFLIEERGAGSLESIWRRDRAEVYYQGKEPGLAGFSQFLRDYAGMAERLFTTMPFQKICISIDDADWYARENRMLAFLEIPRQKPHPGVIPDGVYRNDSHGFAICVRGDFILDPSGQARKTFAVAERIFGVERLPILLCYDGLYEIRTAGLAITEEWTREGTVFMRPILYRQLGITEAGRIREIDASQFIGRAWRDVDGVKQLVEINYQDPDFPNGYENHFVALQETITGGGSALGAFDGDKLVGFCTVNTDIFGTLRRYALLDQIFVSLPYRAKGIGRQLFMRSVTEAKQFGADAYYICAGSSEETLVFYQAIGCAEADEINTKLYESDTRDIQLQYVFPKP